MRGDVWWGLAAFVGAVWTWGALVTLGAIMDSVPKGHKWPAWKWGLAVVFAAAWPMIVVRGKEKG